MKFVSLFSGIEACSEAWVGPLGWEPLAYAEVDPFACHVLAHRHGASRPARMPDPDAPGLDDETRDSRRAAIRAVAKLPEVARVPNVGDVTQHDWSQYRGRAERVVGGPPCQAFSVAGLRQSLSDARGNLSLEYVRAIRSIDPLWTVTENVPGWLSTRDNAFGCFLAALVGEDAALVPTGGRWTDAGVVAGPERTAAWRILDAQFFGVAQRRRRVFVLSVRGAGDFRCAEALFPLGQGVPRHPPARRKAGEGTTGTLAARTAGGGGLGTDLDLAHARRGDSHDLETRDDGLANAVLTPNGGRAGIGVGAVAVFDPNQITNKDNRSACEPGLANTLPNAPNAPVAFGGATAVRRLTPRECERLMNQPDDATLVPYRGKPAQDGPRYKSLGNSMVVSVMAWLGRRIAAVTPPDSRDPKRG